MKKGQLILITILTLILSSCLDEEHITPIESEISSPNNSSWSIPSVQLDGPTVSRDQVVVRYNSSLTNVQKLGLRSDYETLYNFTILNIDSCGCGINDLELWTIDTTQLHSMGLDIKHVVSGLKNKTGEGDLNGDYQFNIQVLNDSLQGGHFFKVSDKVVIDPPVGSIKIAVIDTGVDYDFFANRFLYNNLDNPIYPTEVSGWDFTNDDYDPRDDKGHGTFVTKIITNKLDDLSIPYQILAVKSFDENGVGTYFSAVCGLRYVLQKPDIDLVNMSFGWDQIDDQVIMKSIIEEGQNILFVTSAGNDGVDTDSPDHSHYPSGYDAENLLTVAGHIDDGNGLSPLSNFGELSVDIAAPFNFDLQIQSPAYQIGLSVKGTSYSCPYALVKGAQLLYNTPLTDPLSLKDEIITSGQESVNMKGLISSERILVDDSPVHR